MAHTYLLEIGLEEMPAHEVTESVNQLVNRTSDYLKKEKINFDNIKPFSTPRRLALRIDGLSDKQPDVNQSIKGPAKKIAQDEEGNWTKAAIGFTKGQGLTPEDIVFKELKGTEYAFVQKHILGKPVSKILTGIKTVITKMSFSTMMRWGDYNFSFIRPIRWVVSLLDNQVIPFKILDISTDRITYGHRFLGHKVSLKNADDYEKTLNDEYVIVDADKRKNLITNQINKIAQDKNWNIKVDPNLLEEVNNLVEWPTAFAGDFNSDFLSIPSKVLITSMRDNQRYFYVEDNNGKLLPHFIGVRNGNDKYMNNIITGNEKVLTARLDDAMFFYQEDKKHSIDYFVDRLKHVSFHDKISTMYEKMQRVNIIANYLGKQFKLNDVQLKNLDRASHIYKFDLETQMVGEFSELQGFMGSQYALLQGENKEVAQAVKEQYMPISSNGELPSSKIGAILSLSDKFDSILTFFAAGMIPSGSHDPYALRRQAIGIVRIIRQKQWDLSLGKFMQVSIKNEDKFSVAPNLDQQSIISEVIDFIKGRIIKLLQSENVRHDIIDAVTKSSNDDVLFILQSANVLNEHKNDSNFESSIESLTRVIRITKPNKSSIDNLNINTDLFENESESSLYDAINKIKDDYYSLKPIDIYTRLVNIGPAISDYFDQTMVMSKDKNQQNNHLKLLTLLSKMILWLGDLNQLVVK